MTDQGLLQPIVVRSLEGGGYLLVAGLHRFEAAKKLKWKTISCTVFDDISIQSRAHVLQTLAALPIGRDTCLPPPTFKPLRSPRCAAMGRGGKTHGLLLAGMDQTVAVAAARSRSPNAGLARRTGRRRRATSSASRTCCSHTSMLCLLIQLRQPKITGEVLASRTSRMPKRAAFWPLPPSRAAAGGVDRVDKPRRQPAS